MKISPIVGSFVLAILTVAPTTCALTTDDLLQTLFEQQDYEIPDIPPKNLKENESDERAFAYVKYTVLPSKAEAFIKVIEESKEAAKELEGFITYNLVKTLNDNVTFLVWYTWATKEDFKNLFKSEALKKVVEFVTKEDILVQANVLKLLV